MDWFLDVLLRSSKLLNTQGEKGRHPKQVRPLSADMEHQVERLDAERRWIFPVAMG